MKEKGRSEEGRWPPFIDPRYVLLLYDHFDILLTVTRLKNCYRETSINKTEKLHVLLSADVACIRNGKCNCKCKSQQFLEMGHQEMR